MSFITVIEYLAVSLFVLYLLGALVAWLYELRKNALYLKMQKELKSLENMRLSAALGYAKTYKIRHDYFRRIRLLEKAQKFILVQVLFMAKYQNKTGKSWL